MEKKLAADHPEKLPPAGNLERWIADPRAASYFGATFVLKAAILAHVASGTGTLAEIAQEHKISVRAAQYHAAMAQKIFFE